MSALDDEVRDTTAQGRPGNDADWAVLHTRLGNVAMASRPLDGAAFSKDDGKGRGGVMEARYVIGGGDPRSCCR